VQVYCYNESNTLQTEFSPVGAEWYYTYTVGCCPEEHFNRVVSEKDTIVEENSCRILRQYYDNSTIASDKHIIKQEQGKVYYYYQDQFNLLFDFDAGVNDIVEFTFMYKKYDDDFPLGKDTVFSAKFRVENITTNTQNLKTFTTKALEENVSKFSGITFFPHTYIYVEKIGLKNLLGSPLHRKFIPVFDNLQHPAIDIYRWLRCYSDANFSFMSDEWKVTSLPCDYSVATGISTPPAERSVQIMNELARRSVFRYVESKANVLACHKT
jgi:hypothetical protein